MLELLLMEQLYVTVPEIVDYNKFDSRYQELKDEFLEPYKNE